jgi:Zn-dependent M32 family carboxypeptidase
MFHQLSERLAANYAALEKATTEIVEISRHRIEVWRRETREFTALLSDLERRLPAAA